EHHLRRQPGVVDAAFNLGTMEVRVEYLPGATDQAALRRAIADLGYHVGKAPGPGTTASVEDTEQAARAAEYRALHRRFVVAAALAAPLLVIAMSHGRIAWLAFPGVHWLQLALATPVVAWCGAQFYYGAWAAFRHRAADMNTLIALGTGAAYAHSVVA